MQNRNSHKAIKNQGLGKTVPPLKQHVLIWFGYMGATGLMAEDFWRFYKSRKWCNNKGILIKDWKMRAWEWLWEN